MHAESSLNELLAYTIKGKGEALLWVSQTGHMIALKWLWYEFFFFLRKYFAYHMYKPIPIE